MNLGKIISEEIKRINEENYYFNRSESGRISELDEDLDKYRSSIDEAMGAENVEVAKKSFEKASYALEVFEDTFESMLTEEDDIKGYNYFSYEENFSHIVPDLNETKLSARKLADSLQLFLEKLNERGTENMDGDIKKILGNIYLVQYMIYNIPNETRGE